MPVEANIETTFQSGRKQHFAVLDGLRGVAALCVVIFHFTEDVCNYSNFGMCHGFLAVDFFFCLSGFVLGYAYDDRIAELGFWHFLKARLVRLQPMVVFGALLGFGALAMDSFRTMPGASPAQIALTLAAAVMLVPYSAAREHSGDLFSLNPPSWSLFWEYGINMLFGLAFHRIRRRALVVLTAVSAIILCLAGHQAGNLSGGWNTGNLSQGGARVAFSFCAGLLVYRMGWRLRTRLGFAGLSILLVLAFFMPFVLGAWLREAATIMFYFPLLVALGAGAVVLPKTERICRMLGDLSYPLYMTHYALVRTWGHYVDGQKLAGWNLWLSIVIGVLGAVVFAWSVLKFFDEPVRTRLARATIRQPDGGRVTRRSR